jgi:hypothetical protein
VDVTISIEHLLTVVGILVGIAGGGFAFWLRVRNENKKMGVLEFQVNVMWEIHLRRIQAEAVRLGHGETKSPFIAYPESAAMFGPLLQEMKRFLDVAVAKPLRDNEIIMLLEHEFGARLVEQTGTFSSAVVALSLIRKGPVDIESIATMPIEKVVRELAKAPVLGAAMKIVRLAGESSDSAIKLDMLIDETKKQTGIIERASEEVHEMHEEAREDSAIRKRQKP